MLCSVWEDVENTGFHDPLFHELTSAGHHHVSDASQLLACGIGVAGFSPMFNAFKHYPQSEHRNPLTISILTMVELVRYSFWALLPESSSLTKPGKPKIVIRIVTVRRIGRLSHTKRERISVPKAKSVVLQAVTVKCCSHGMYQHMHPAALHPEHAPQCCGNVGCPKKTMWESGRNTIFGRPRQCDGSAISGGRSSGTEAGIQCISPNICTPLWPERNRLWQIPWGKSKQIQTATET